MARIVITNRIPTEGVELLKAEHDVWMWDEEETISREECLRRIAGADAVLTLLTEKVDDEFLDAAGEQLKVAANVASAVNVVNAPNAASASPASSKSLPRPKRTWTTRPSNRTRPWTTLPPPPAKSSHATVTNGIEMKLIMIMLSTPVVRTMPP